MFAAELVGILRTVAASARMAPSGATSWIISLALATRVTGQNEMQIADLVGLQVPFRLVIGPSRRQLAALWQSPYGDDAAGRHSISTIERNWARLYPRPAAASSMAAMRGPGTELRTGARWSLSLAGSSRDIDQGISTAPSQKIAPSIRFGISATRTRPATNARIS